ncbi:MAG: DUF1513 domain-containing protein [Pseudomonadota bacterium]
MTSRRSFLCGILASGVAPAASWADAGAPTHLAAARRADGRYVLCGLGAEQGMLFSIPLPDRGHAAAAHPTRPEAIAFARRPGTFALVLDCRNGDVLAHLAAPAGRHFYGHGAFSQDGRLLFTTENDFEMAEGRIGVWDATRRYARVGEIASGGTGPHDVRILPGRDILVVANGGIETHPESGRTKLNLPTMRPNLSYLSFEGDILDQVEPPRDHHLNSIRHLSVRADGLVAYATQWQGALSDTPPLLGLHTMGRAVRHLSPNTGLHRDCVGYAGSVAFRGDGRAVAITAPRGGIALIFDVEGGHTSNVIRLEDVSGVAADRAALLFTSGTGALFRTQDSVSIELSDHGWDNHLIELESG